ncbi:MAG: NAD(P)/FAD-dependent oxidoreductase [Chloroflexota bacterium]
MMTYNPEKPNRRDVPTKPPTFDAVIIGGGLAGCSAAITLAERGWRVALIEAGDYPRHRVCGEFMSPECVDTLNTLGAMPAIREHAPTWMTYAVITTPSGITWEGDLPATAMGISRYALDAILAQRAENAGAAVFTNSRATSIEGNLRDGFTITAGKHTLHAKTVIGAHGKRSNLDRALNRSFLQQRQPFVGLKMHYEAPPITSRVELHTFTGGYCGLSDVEGGVVNACLLAREDVFRAAGSIPAFVEWMRSENPALNAWMAEATPVLDRWQSIAQVPFVDKRAVEHDILMTGDAAGLIAPLAGNGMGMGMDGGVLAARYIHDYLSGDLTAPALAKNYAAAWRRQFAGRMHTGRFLQALMFRPGLLAAGLRAANTLPALGDFFIRNTRDVKP